MYIVNNIQWEIEKSISMMEYLMWMEPQTYTIYVVYIIYNI